MFLNNDHKTRMQHLYRRAYCASLVMLLAAGNVLGEDDPIEIDPNASHSILELINRLWRFLIGLF